MQLDLNIRLNKMSLKSWKELYHNFGKYESVLIKDTGRYS